MIEDKAPYVTAVTAHSLANISALYAGHEQ